ncbi:dTDP-4-dehydrorhamnose 3,5-epimerase [Rhizobium puerariae]|uniref:dTDP-4-dehydrorhamnose 3,5-epimerase n=1 Tax=Rhizobium puerariae TaxID=1585791 RepID=A0ABV6AV73_9HYPH
MLEVKELGLPGVLEIKPKKFGDHRGFFSETYNASKLLEHKIDLTFVQDNQSYSASRGTVRGLHFQIPPHGQDKLVRVIKGSIFDVAVDIRKGSPTFGQWVGLTLSADEWNQILVPKGYAHGFMTLEDHTEVIYKVTDYYAADCDRSIRYNDPAIGISWPELGGGYELSEKDQRAPLLNETDTGFSF